MAQLRASNLAKAYRGREVIHDVSVEIESGQIVGSGSAAALKDDPAIEKAYLGHSGTA